MASYNIEIQRFNGSSYDTLYPKTLASNVSGSSSLQIDEGTYYGTNSYPVTITIGFVPDLFIVCNQANDMMRGMFYRYYQSSNYYISLTNNGQVQDSGAKGLVDLVQTRAKATTDGITLLSDFETSILFNSNSVQSVYFKENVQNLNWTNSYYKYWAVKF